MFKNSEELKGFKKAVIVQALTVFIGIFLFVPTIVHNGSAFFDLCCFPLLLITPVLPVINLLGLMVNVSKGGKFGYFLFFIYFVGFLSSIFNLCVWRLACRTMFFQG